VHPCGESTWPVWSSLGMHKRKAAVLATVEMDRIYFIELSPTWVKLLISNHGGV